MTGLWAAECQTRLRTSTTNNAPLTVPPKMHLAEVAHSGTRRDERPSVSADSASCIQEQLSPRHSNLQGRRKND
jgi:hypothetical protein